MRIVFHNFLVEVFDKNQYACIDLQNRRIAGSKELARKASEIVRDLRKAKRIYGKIEGREKVIVIEA